MNHRPQLILTRRARPAAWLAAVQVVAIDPSATFRKALRTHLPTAGVSVDPFHLVQLANETVTAVRQRLVREQTGRRGRAADTAWAHRQLLLRGADTLSERGWARLGRVFRDGDPTDELGAAWGVKEQLRILLKTTTLAGAHEAKMLLGHYVQVSAMAETDRLWNTICAWWNEIETLLITGVTNARTEAANTTIKNIKRTGRGFRNQDNYRSRILLNSAAKRAA
jgi:transposase